MLIEPDIDPTLAEIERLKEASEIVAYALLYQMIHHKTGQVLALRNKGGMAIRGEALMPPGRQGRTLQAALDTILGAGQVEIETRGDDP